MRFDLNSLRSEILVLADGGDQLEGEVHVTPFGGFRGDRQRRSVSQRVFEVIEVGGCQRNESTAEAHVEKVVTQAEIE